MNKIKQDLEPVLSDTTHGASFLQARIIETLAQGLLREKSENEDFNEQVYQEITQFIETRRPDLPSLMNTAQYFFTEIMSNTGIPREQAIIQAQQAYASLEEQLHKGFIQVYVRLHKERAIKQIILLSHSRTISQALIHLNEYLNEHEMVAPKLVILESRPKNEGALLAMELKEKYDVHVIIDIGFYLFLLNDPEHTIVLLGADALLEDGVINKIGSRVLAESLRKHGGRVFVLSSFLKRVPKKIRDHEVILRDPTEITRAWVFMEQHVQDALQDVVFNTYFEAVPHDMIDEIITEESAKKVNE